MTRAIIHSTTTSTPPTPATSTQGIRAVVTKPLDTAAVMPRSELISGTSEVVSAKATITPTKLTLFINGLSQGAVDTALCDDTVALCDDSVILAGEYIDYSQHPRATLVRQRLVLSARRQPVAGVING